MTKNRNEISSSEKVEEIDNKIETKMEPSKNNLEIDITIAIKTKTCKKIKKDYANACLLTIKYVVTHKNLKDLINFFSHNYY